ncbi:hypothetical protein ACMXYN_10290 [Neptuniibacter sp. PT8_73]|uniref:hypothetical protein n=1 Tax=unclassified Neptuniibacter TaxID=2630693 RepID=UPI0039F68B34
MRTVKVRHLYGVGETSAPWENHPLDEFIFLHPFLGFALACLKVMPPLTVLNDAFCKSVSDSGMSGGIEWRPFEIDCDEYSELVEVLYTDPKRDIVLDEELDRIKTFKEWNKKAMIKYNPRYRDKN